MAKPHPQDTLLVCNIDIACDETSYDVVPTYYKETDEETGEAYQRFGNRPYEFNHGNYFAVRWGGQEHRVKPGETRLMPRFLAEHYAKHLADHILSKREVAEKKPGYVTSAIERPKTLAKIILKTVQSFQDNSIDDEGLAALEQVQQINQGLDLGNGDVAKAQGRSHELGGIDAGVVHDPTLGVLTQTQPKSVDEVLAEAGEQTEARPLPTRPELIKEAHALGIPFDPKATREELAAKIKAF